MLPAICGLSVLRRLPRGSSERLTRDRELAPATALTGENGPSPPGRNPFRDGVALGGHTVSARRRPWAPMG